MNNAVELAAWILIPAMALVSAVLAARNAWDRAYLPAMAWAVATATLFVVMDKLGDWLR